MKFRQYKARIFIILYVSLVFMLSSFVFGAWTYTYKVDKEREIVGYYEHNDRSYYIYRSGDSIKKVEIDNSQLDYFKSKIGKSITIKLHSNLLGNIAILWIVLSTMFFLFVILEKRDCLHFDR